MKQIKADRKRYCSPAVGFIRSNTVDGGAVGEVVEVQNME